MPRMVRGRSSAEFLDAAIRRLDSSIGRRDNPRSASAESDIRHMLDEASSADTSASQWPSSKRFARALGTTTVKAEKTLIALAQARLLRRVLAFEHGRRADVWRPRRRGLTDRIVRVLLGLDPMPPPRPFLGDADGFILPPRPGKEADLRVSWKRGALTIRGPRGATLTATGWSGIDTGFYLENESNHELAELAESYGRRTIGYINHVAVPHGARGSGVGRSMLSEAMWQMFDRGLDAVFLHAYPLDAHEVGDFDDDAGEDELDDFYRDAGLHYRDCCDGDLKPVYWFDFASLSVKTES